MSESSVQITKDSEGCLVYEVSQYGFTWLHAHVYVRLMRFAGRFLRDPHSPRLHIRDAAYYVKTGTMTFVVCIAMYDKMYILDYLQARELADSVAEDMQKFFHDIKEPNWRQAKRINRITLEYGPDSMAIAVFSHFVTNSGVRAMFKYIHPTLPLKICSTLSYGPTTEEFQAFLKTEYGKTKNMNIVNVTEPLGILLTPEDFASVGIHL